MSDSSPKNRDHPNSFDPKTSRIRYIPNSVFNLSCPNYNIHGDDDLDDRPTNQQTLFKFNIREVLLILVTAKTYWALSRNCFNLNCI